MLSGTNIVYSALLTVFYLKQKIYRHHYLGIAIILVGTVIVGLNSIINDSSGELSRLTTTEIVVNNLQL